MRQNAELRQTLDKKNIEIAEFVELITNLNGLFNYALTYIHTYIHTYMHTFEGIVLHLKSLTSNLKEEVQQYESKVEALTADGEKVACCSMYVCMYVLYVCTYVCMYKTCKRICVRMYVCTFEVLRISLVQFVECIC